MYNSAKDVWQQLQLQFKKKKYTCGCQISSGIKPLIFK